jgi:hypothetical protein
MMSELDEMMQEFRRVVAGQQRASIASAQLAALVAANGGQFSTEFCERSCAIADRLLKTLEAYGDEDEDAPLRRGFVMSGQARELLIAQGWIPPDRIEAAIKSLGGNPHNPMVATLRSLQLRERE